MRIDVHQHIWTPELREALARRERLPLIRVESGLTRLHSAGEHACVLDTAAEAPERRRALLDRDGLDGALVAISSPIGIEALPREQALPLIDAQLRGVARLGPRFRAWGPLPCDRPQPEDVDRLVEQGAVGISLAAGALGTPARLEDPDLRRTLAHVAARGLALFIHPGRSCADRPGCADLDEPLWWRALSDYVTQMQAAWLSWVSAGRRDHPTLTVVFAMLAGLAPLQHERLATRGGPRVYLHDRHTFYDSSSYGPDAVATAARTLGSGRLLYGSDRPVVEPLASGYDAILQANAGSLFGHAFKTAEAAAGPHEPAAGPHEPAAGPHEPAGPRQAAADADTLGLAA